MNLSELRTRIRSLIREPRENFIRDDELNAWFNDMSYECTKDLLYPWKEWTVHGIEEQADYTVPTDFIQVHPLLNVMFGDERAEKRDVVWLEHTDPNYRSVRLLEFDVFPENILSMDRIVFQKKVKIGFRYSER